MDFHAEYPLMLCFWEHPSFYNNGEPLSNHQVMPEKNWAVTVKVNQTIALVFFF